MIQKQQQQQQQRHQEVRREKIPLKQWIEKSRYHWLMHLFFLSLVPLWFLFSWELAYCSNYSQKVGIFLILLYPVWSFGVLPIVDTVMSHWHVHAVEKSHFSDKDFTKKSKMGRSRAEEEALDNRYTNVLRFYALAHTASIIYSIYHVKFLQREAQVEWYKSTVFWGQFVSLGLAQAAPASSVSHELYHRLKKLDQFLGKLLLTTMMYTHFSIEHVYGHHKHVGTVNDPATARFHQSVYAFFIQSSIGGYINSWFIENEQLKMTARQNQNHNHSFTLPNGISLKRFMLNHRILHYSIICYLLIPMVTYLWGGWSGVTAFVLQAFVGIWFVEVVNYFEHYGLERDLKHVNGSGGSNESAVYEPVQEFHSWDMPTGHMSKLSYCNLVLHSDHHHHPLKHYEYLEASKNENTPTLPYSYAMMVLMSMVPPLFFKVMHKQPVFQQEKYKRYGKHGNVVLSSTA